MSLNIQENVSLLEKNSLGVPAYCDAYVEIEGSTELSTVIDYASTKKLSIFFLGEGTNLVLGKTVSGLVVRANIKGIDVLEGDKDYSLVRVGAGENWHDLVNWAMDKGFYGLENLALIPGSCGAAPVQNIGAYGVEISRYIQAVEYVDLAARKTTRLSNEQCHFGYRDSVFKHELKGRALITHIELKIPKKIELQYSYPALASYLEQHSLTPSSEAIYEAVCACRRSKLPDVKDIPNVGSFFKNPVISEEKYRELKQKNSDIPCYALADNDLSEVKEVKVPAAWLIDKLGWKGKLENGVGVHKAQALVIVNPGHKTGERILQFAEKITQDVQINFGVELEIEPRVVI